MSGSVVWLCVWVAVVVLFAQYGRVSVLEDVHEFYREGLLILSPAPFGWKLEPRLYWAIRTGVVFYLQSFRNLVFLPFVSLGLAPAVLSAGMTWSLLTRSWRGLFVALWILLGFAGGFLVALLAFVSHRVCERMAQLLWSLALLFAGRFRSTLKKRTEPLNASLDSVLLGLLLFTAVLLLFPVLLLNAVLFAVLDIPRIVLASICG